MRYVEPDIRNSRINIPIGYSHLNTISVILQNSLQHTKGLDLAMDLTGVREQGVAVPCLI
jgi:hypothetical protein